MALESDLAELQQCTCNMDFVSVNYEAVQKTFKLNKGFWTCAENYETQQ